jgi:PIN domain nuclease of toxin-antitoxin system
VNLLLDTHVALWAFGAPERLGHRTQAAIVDPRNTVVVSAATVWEVEIKRVLGKLEAPDGFAALCAQRGFDELPITFEHAEQAARLPRHHDDPFDRMLIGQALAEQLQLVTADPMFARYEAAVRSPFE